MIVITGSILAKPETEAALVDAALGHSARSRAEDGCLSHRCYRDMEEPLRLFFYEEWRDMAAVKAHFAHADTGIIMGAIRELAAGSEGPVILQAEAVARG